MRVVCEGEEESTMVTSSGCAQLKTSNSRTTTTAVQQRLAGSLSLSQVHKQAKLAAIGGVVRGVRVRAWPKLITVTQTGKASGRWRGGRAAAAAEDRQPRTRAVGREVRGGGCCGEGSKGGGVLW